MVEKNFQSLFTAWIKDHPPEVSTVFELKLEKGRAVPFDRVASHQIEALLSAKFTGLYHKIADSPVSWMKGTPMRFGKPKPFDCLYVRNAEAYVVLLFYKLRAKKEMVFIDINEWVDESKRSTRKSLTEDRAREISYKIIKL